MPTERGPNLHSLAIRQPHKISVERGLTMDRYIPWLGARYELEGGMYLNIKPRKSRGGQLQVLPSITTLDSPENTLQLQSIFGGKMYEDLRPHKERIMRWQLTGKKAAELAISLREFAPSWQETILAYENWLLVDSNVAEQASVADDLHNHLKESIGKKHGREPVDKASYSKLVRNPAFLAGIVDLRGYLAKGHTVHNTQQYCLQLGTTNLPLVEALKEVYGGDWQVNTEAGLQKTNEKTGMNFTTLKASYDYSLGIEGSRKIAQAIQGFILFKRDIIQVLIDQ